MPMQYATITGRITVPNSDIGIRSKVTFTPQTTGNILTFSTDSGRVTIGAVEVETDKNGNLGPDAKIPLGSDQGPVLWRIMVEPMERKGRGANPWALGIVPITASTTFAALTEGQVAVEVVTPTLVADVGALVVEAEQARNEAEAAAASVQRDQPNGVAPLDENRKLPELNIPARLAESALDADYEPMTVGGKRAVRKGELVHNVRDYGAKGDSTTDDTTAIQNAITAAGSGGTILLPPGRYKTGPLTMLNWQTLVGGVQQRHGGSSVPTELLFTGLTGSQVGITTAASTTIRDVRLAGPGATVGTCVGISSPSTTVNLEGVTLYRWKTGASLFQNYYTILTRCEFRFNSTGLAMDNCYNLTLTSTVINANIDGAGAYGVGISCTNPCMFTLHGGSVEMYGTGIVMSSNSSLTMFGTYWEAYSTNAYGISAGNKSNVLVNAYGCQVYLGGHTAWAYMDAVTGGTLNARGNKFKAASSTTAAPVAYWWSATPAIDIDLSGDDWTEVTVAGALYRRDVATPVRARVSDPTGATGTNIKPDRHYLGRSAVVPAGSFVRTGAAATASRPDPAAAGAGAMFYDTTLGKPIWSNGTNWRDATNTVV